MPVYPQPDGDPGKSYPAAIWLHDNYHDPD